MTIDLSGIGPQMQARSAAGGKTVATTVRAAVVAMLDSPECRLAMPKSRAPTDHRTVKVTLRINASHAARLADRARTADVSQGAYVAALLDGISVSPRSNFTATLSLRSPIRPRRSLR